MRIGRRHPAKWILLKIVLIVLAAITAALYLAGVTQQATRDAALAEQSRAHNEALRERATPASQPPIHNDRA